MKKIWVLPFYFLTFLLLSCTLDEEPRDQIPEEKAYNTPKALYLNTVATLYYYIGGHNDGQGLQGTCRGIYDLQTFGSDEAMLPTRSGDWYDGGIWQQMYCHTWSAGHEIVNNSWLYLYEIINKCNRSIEQIETHREMLGENLYNYYKSEVRALRAIYYWYLLDLFGRVPIVTSTHVSMNEVRQSERKEVFDFTVKELQEACVNLYYDRSVEPGDYYGRVTAPVVWFALAKLMLNAEVYCGTPHWKECLDYCNEIKSADYSLEEFYVDNFAVSNEHSHENIWTIPMNKDLFANEMQYQFRSLHPRHAAAYGFSGENGTCATRHTLQVFGYGTDDQDTRFTFNYWADDVFDLNGTPVLDRTGNPLVYYPWDVALDISGTSHVETAGARMKKYAIDRNAQKDGKLMDNDIVLFRFADVLLMSAECKLRLGLDGQEDFDLVRERASMLPRPLTLQNLLDERLLELCWEGWRRQDLIRFEQYKSLYTDEFTDEDRLLGHPLPPDESDGHTTVFPIPANILNQNPNMTQNPGY